MNARATATAAQLDLLAEVGLDADCLHRIGVPGDAARRLRARWDGDRLPCVGEAQLRCDTCGLAAAVRFRCAGRCERDCEHGERAAAAMVRVIPRVPVRHWVLRLPGVLCSASAVDQRLVRELSREFLAQVFAFVRQRVPAGPSATQCGGVSLVHRTARALVLDVHVHALVLDGGYVAVERGLREFVPMADEPTPEELAALAVAVRERLLARWRRRRGASDDREQWRVAIEQSLVAGPVAATAVRRIRVEGVGPGRPRRVGAGARKDGFGVHAMERIDGAARGSLAALARYLVRAPVALAELGAGGEGRVVQRLSRPFADGSTHVEFSTVELARRLVALTPAGHVHRVSYHGALAPGAAAKWRARPLQLALVDASHLVRARGTRRRDREPWPSPSCDRCGGRMRVVAIDEGVDASPIVARPA
jgi:hypothetical protein